MDIVVTIPSYVNDEHVLCKFENPLNSFWTLPRIPVRLTPSDLVWFVRDNKVVHALNISKIELNPHTPVPDALGHNPSAPRGCRIWFDDLPIDIESQVLDSDGSYKIKIKGFQGFRYRWWNNDTV